MSHGGVAMAVQYLHVLPEEAASSSESHRAAYWGPPEVVNIMTLAAWPALRHETKRWKTAPSTVHGCLALSDSADAAPGGDWRSATWPPLLALEMLAAGGWRPGEPSGPHKLDSPKIVQVDNPFKWSAYLRCLCGLEWLISEKKKACLLCQPSKTQSTTRVYWRPRIQQPFH